MADKIFSNQYGDYSNGLKVTLTEPQKENNRRKNFWNKIKVKGDDDCWEWTGCLSSSGYGSFRYKGKTMKSSRLSFMFKHGYLSDLYVCHSCDNRLCCNPNHLFLGTPQDNSVDMVNKGRNFSVRGESNGRAKLSELDVKDIHWLINNGIKRSVIAECYNITKQLVYQIIKGKAWSHLNLNKK